MAERTPNTTPDRSSHKLGKEGSSEPSVQPFIYCKLCGTKHPENTYRCISCGDLLHPVPAVKPTVIIREGGLSMVLPHKNPYSLWAYYCGVFSYMPLIGIPLAIVAIATGVMGIYRFKTVDEAKGILHSAGGLLLGFFALLLQIVLFKVLGQIDLSTYRSLFNGEMGF